jgi:hypothetical protein
VSLTLISPSIPTDALPFTVQAERRSAPRQWLPKLDAMATDWVGNGQGQAEVAARRRLRLALRALGRLAEAVQVLRCKPAMAIEFLDRARSGVERGEIGVTVEVSVKEGKEICRSPLYGGQSSR